MFQLCSIWIKISFRTRGHCILRQSNIFLPKFTIINLIKYNSDFLFVDYEVPFKLFKQLSKEKIDLSFWIFYKSIFCFWYIQYKATNICLQLFSLSSFLRILSENWKKSIKFWNLLFSTIIIIDYEDFLLLFCDVLTMYINIIIHELLMMMYVSSF